MSFGGLTTFQGGASVTDAILAGIGVFPARDGRILFVDSVNGRGANSGNGPDEALAIVNQAVAKCTASRYDVIICMPGHTEVLTAAAGVLLSKIGITLVGLGHGRGRPTFTYTTAAGASFDVTAAKCRIINCVFSAIGVDAVTAMINVSAASCTIEGCELETGDATNQAVLGVLTTAAADRFRFVRNFVHGSANAGTAAAIRLVGGDACEIRDNTFIGDYTTSLGAIDNVTTATTNCVVDNNRIVNRTASSTKAMVFVATSTGMISNNRMQILSGATPITGAAMSWVGGNYYGATIAQLGVLI
jgi:hypothetical protein